VVRLIAANGYELRKMLVPAITVLRNGAAVPKVWNI
jgi:urease accessory protein